MEKNNQLSENDNSFEEVSHGNKIMAMILRSSFNVKGIKFFTPSSFSQQLGYMNRPAGYAIEPHIHKEIKREIYLTQEVLIIKTGIIKVNFYDDTQNYLQSRVLQAGDIILLASCGHGIDVLENAEIVEIKQGPYAGDEDKIRFTNLVK